MVDVDMHAGEYSSEYTLRDSRALHSRDQDVTEETRVDDSGETEDTL